MRQYIEDVLSTKSATEFIEKSDLIIKFIDPEVKQKEWVPFKVKKFVVDKIKTILKAEPQEHSAKDKLVALKLLNRAILKKNQEFNRYVEQTLMARLSILAQYNPLDDSVMNTDILNQSSMSIQNTAQELMTRGQHMFSPEEKDTQSSSHFLVTLLDFIEKWSNLEETQIADSSNAEKDKIYTFKMVFQDLHEIKQITFPSKYRQPAQQSSPNIVNDSNKKSVKFDL